MKALRATLADLTAAAGAGLWKLAWTTALFALFVLALLQIPGLWG